MIRRRRRVLLIPLLILFVLATIIIIRNAGRDDDAGPSEVEQPTATEPAETPAGPADTPDGEPEGVQVTSITTLIDEVGGRVDWSHAHGMIAYSMRGEDDLFDVYTMNPDGSDQVCLTCGKPGVPQLHNGQPAWHPSGDWIMFQAQDPDLELPAPLQARESYLAQGGVGINNNLWLTNRDGTEFHQLTQIESREASLHPHFSHDGTKLFWGAIDRMGRPIGGQWMLKIADFSFDSDGVPRLTNERSYRPMGNGDTFYESHGFTPDDRKVIFSASIGRESEFDMDQWIMDLETEQLTQLTDSPGVWDEHGQISPSGEKIVWISSQGYEVELTANWARTLRTDYWLMNIDGSDKQRVTFFNEEGHDHHTSGERIIAADSSWNPDGTAIIASLGVISGFQSESRIVLIEFDRPL